MTLMVKPEVAAEELQIGRTRVYAEIASGRLASVKIGRSRLIPRQALDAFVALLIEEQASADGTG